MGLLPSRLRTCRFAPRGEHVAILDEHASAEKQILALSGQGACALEGCDCLIGRAASRFDTCSISKTLCSTDSVTTARGNTERASARRVTLIDVADSKCDFCRGRGQTLFEVGVTQLIGDREALGHGAARFIQSATLKAKLRDVVQRPCDAGVIAGLAECAHAQPEALRRIVDVANERREHPEIELDAREQRVITGRNGVQRGVVVLAFRRGQVPAPVRDAGERRLRPRDANRVADELCGLEATPKECFRFAGRADVEKQGAVPAMEIGVERRCRRAVDEGHRHFEGDTRFGDTAAVLVIVRAGHQLARFLRVSAGSRCRKSVGGLRVAAKVRLVRRHGTHTADVFEGMPAAENRMRAVSVAE
jgi:hypothetical protein